MVTFSVSVVEVENILVFCIFAFRVIVVVVVVVVVIKDDAAAALLVGDERAKDDDAFGICRSDSDKNARANLIFYRYLSTSFFSACSERESRPT